MRTRFIVATRYDEDAFFRRSLLAQSLENLQDGFSFVLEPSFQSSAGMAAVYNPAIDLDHWTWPIALFHGSYGRSDEGWHKARNIYLDKWSS